MSEQFFTRGVQNLFGQGNSNNNANNGTGNEMNFETLLHSVFGGAHDSFEAATRMAMEASMQETDQQPKGAPPASQRALKSLPLIQIRSEDLVDPANRECAVCLEEHELGKQCVRMPCAHIFHKECVLDWLKAHCTCPVCRYELPTDDANYERRRVQRMRNRKPRYARHELERLTIRELKLLLPVRDTYQAVDRSDLVDHLIKSGAIDLIASPEPIEYSLSALRQMSVSRLRRCMNEEAGVFFDPKDVVEKDDMIRIFLGSGRLAVLPEDDTEPEEEILPSGFGVVETSPSVNGNAPLVETVDEPSPIPRDLRNDTTIVMEESGPEEGDTNANTTVNAHNNIDDIVNYDTVNDDTVDDAGLGCASTVGAPDNGIAIQQELVAEEVSGVSEIASEMDDTDCEDDELDDQEREIQIQEECIGEVASAELQSTEHDTVEPSAVAERDTNVSSESESDRKRPIPSSETFDKFDSMSISQLRQSANFLSVDLSGCIEKGEMVDRLCVSEHEIISSLYGDMSASELLTVASLVGVEKMNGNHEELLMIMEQEARDRPHLVSFVRALKPFLRLTVPQLRSVARERGVNVSQCLEKTDILRCLVSI